MNQKIPQGYQRGTTRIYDKYHIFYRKHKKYDVYTLNHAFVAFHRTIGENIKNLNFVVAIMIFGGHLGLMICTF